MIDKMIVKLRRYDKLDPEEEAALLGAVTEIKKFARGTVLVRRQTPTRACEVVVSGLVHRYRDLSDGRRQSMELSIPGDFVDLHSFTMKEIDHDIACLTQCQVAIVPHDRLEQITTQFPHLGRVLWLSTMIDAAIHREWIVSLGARSAVQRLAHLFCEMAVRLESVGLADADGYRFPITQNALSELLGMSMVHVNRTVKELRERELVVFREQQVRIQSWEGLVRLADFDPFYLGMHRRPR